MTTYIFICPDCEQEITVNDSMLEAIRSAGCPVCTASVESTNFEET